MTICLKIRISGILLRHASIAYIWAKSKIFDQISIYLSFKTNIKNEEGILKNSLWDLGVQLLLTKLGSSEKVTVLIVYLYIN